MNATKEMQDRWVNEAGELAAEALKYDEEDAERARRLRVRAGYIEAWAMRVPQLVEQRLRQVEAAGK